jgi:hypothetical protein
MCGRTLAVAAVPRRASVENLIVKFEQLSLKRMDGIDEFALYDLALDVRTRYTPVFKVVSLA